MTGSATCAALTVGVATPWSRSCVVPIAADESVGKTSKTTLFLTMGWESLRDVAGAARTLGGLDAGAHLAPETVRRLACDARVIPVGLGSQGEVLDLGRAIRFFSPAQIAACGCGTVAAAIRGAEHRPLGRMVITWSTGQTSVPRTSPTPPSCASDTTRSCTSVAWPAESCVVLWVSTSSGTSPGAPTTTCSPDALPRNQRDPAPHPADRSGAVGVRDSRTSVHVGPRHDRVRARRIRSGPDTIAVRSPPGPTRPATHDEAPATRKGDRGLDVLTRHTEIGCGAAGLSC